MLCTLRRISRSHRPTGGNHSLLAMTSAPDGNIWFIYGNVD